MDRQWEGSGKVALWIVRQQAGRGVLRIGRQRAGGQAAERISCREAAGRAAFS